jgi:hypothetical protein
MVPSLPRASSRELARVEEAVADAGLGHQAQVVGIVAQLLADGAGEDPQVLGLVDRFGAPDAPAWPDW